MARLSSTPYPWVKPVDGMLPGETVLEYQRRLYKHFDEEDAAFDALVAKTVALPEGEILGALITYPVGDGLAAYVVVSEDPLTLQWIPFRDEYNADYRLIKGTDKQDVLLDISGRRMLNKIFGGK